MLSMILVVATHILAVPALPARANATPSIYALVYVGKPPKSCPRELHLRSQIIQFNDAVLKTALRADSLSGLKVVKERQETRAWFKEDGPAWLKKHLRVESLAGTNVLRISFSDGSPKEQAIIINSVAKAYHDLVIERQRKELKNQIAHLKTRTLSEIRVRLSSLENEMAMLNAEQATDENDARRIALSRRILGHAIAKMRQSEVRVEDGIRSYEGQVHNLSVFFLEPAEVPESK